MAHKKAKKGLLKLLAVLSGVEGGRTVGGGGEKSLTIIKSERNFKVKLEKNADSFRDNYET